VDAARSSRKDQGKSQTELGSKGKSSAQPHRENEKDSEKKPGG